MAPEILILGSVRTPDARGRLAARFACHFIDKLPDADGCRHLLRSAAGYNLVAHFSGEPLLTPVA
ncbi:MAG: hypothetical protein V7631_4533 [Massilia sp.]|jgi:hypothetical protein